MSFLQCHERLYPKRIMGLVSLFIHKEHRFRRFNVHIDGDSETNSTEHIMS